MYITHIEVAQRVACSLWSKEPRLKQHNMPAAPIHQTATRLPAARMCADKWWCRTRGNLISSAVWFTGFKVHDLVKFSLWSLRNALELSAFRENRPKPLWMAWKVCTWFHPLSRSAMGIILNVRCQDANSKIVSLEVRNISFSHFTEAKGCGVHPCSLD